MFNNDDLVNLFEELTNLIDAYEELKHDYKVLYEHCDWLEAKLDKLEGKE